MGTLECTVQNGQSHHPTLHVSVPTKELHAHVNSGCSAKAYLILPPLAFVDPYELANYEQYYTFKHWGPSNLELPVMAMPNENSTVLLDIPIPDGVSSVELQLPIHLRYESPGKHSSLGYHSVPIDCPTGFMVCPSSDFPGSGSRSRKDDAPRVPTEVSALFDGLGMTLYPLQTHVGTNVSVSIRVPVGNPSDVAYVEAGTAMTIIFCFLYLLRAFLGATRRMSANTRGTKDE